MKLIGSVHVHGRACRIDLQAEPEWRGTMLYIGVDLGTSAVKLLLMEGNGKIVNIVSKEYPLYFPHPGWSEQKPEDWYEQSMEGIKELIAGVDRSEIAGISFG